MLPFQPLQQQFEAIQEEASSRASSPAKSPLMASGAALPAFLAAEAGAEPPLGLNLGGARRGAAAARAARASQQSGLGLGLGSGDDSRQQQQQMPGSGLRPLDLGGASARPSSPPLSQSQYNRWVGDAAARGGGGQGLGGTPPARRGMLFERGAGAAGGAFGMTGGAFGAAAPSDPMTYHMANAAAALDKDGVPNLGDEALGGGTGGGPPAPSDWRIGAQRTATAGASRYSPLPSQGGTPGALAKRGLADKPGAAVKLGRRAAWLKFLAYEGCLQICLEQVLGGGGAEQAAGFLREGCRELKAALGFEALLLPPLGGGAGGLFGGAAAGETAIYWDDKEDGVATAVECIEAAPAPPPPLPPALPAKQVLSLPPARPAPAALRASGSSAASGGTRRGGPFIEARPARVVGCPVLGDGRELYVVLYPSAQGEGREARAWTLVHSDGSTHQVEPLALDNDGAVLNDTVTVELVDRRLGPLAQGTVQVSELHRVSGPALAAATATAAESLLLRVAGDPASLARSAAGASPRFTRLPASAAGQPTGHAV